MLDWVYLAVERWVRANASRTAKLADYVPLWYVRRLSEVKLLRTLRYVYRKSPAQRERWSKAGVKLTDLRSPGVLRHIPLTEGVELAEHPEEYICVPEEELVHVLTSTGNRTKPKKVYLTAEDLEVHVRMMGTHLRRFPHATRAAAVFNTDLPTWSAGTVVRRGIESAGIFGILSHTGRSVPEQIALLKEYQIDALFTMPAYLHRMTVEADGNLRELGIHTIHLGGQAWNEEYRAMTEQAWGAKLIDAYGSMELVCSIASECMYQSGLHVMEVDFWVEIVDPATGRVLPDGEEGEVVVTTLSRRGMPLVRYRTHDLAHLIDEDERCACGLPLRKMSRVRGRLDDTIIVGGDANVYADEWDRALLAIPGVTDYQVILEKDGYKDVLHLKVEGDTAQRDLPDTIREAAVSIPNVKIAFATTRTLTIGKIEVLPRGTLSEGRPKARRVVDKRPSPTAAQPVRADD